VATTAGNIRQIFGLEDQDDATAMALNQAYQDMLEAGAEVHAHDAYGYVVGSCTNQVCKRKNQ